MVVEIIMDLSRTKSDPASSHQLGCLWNRVVKGSSNLLLGQYLLGMTGHRRTSLRVIDGLSKVFGQVYNGIPKRFELRKVLLTMLL
jgi:hypothetical protein